MYSTLLNTVGLSLYHSHSSREAGPSVADTARDILESPTSAHAGPEVNSITLALQKGWASADARLVFYVCDSPPGHWVGQVLRKAYESRGHAVAVREIPGLLDAREPRRCVRTLARALGSDVRQFGLSHCALNASGGNRLHVALATLLGQCLQIPAFFQCEHCIDELVQIPPLPLAPSQDLWQAYAWTLELLAHQDQPVEQVEMLIEEPELKRLLDFTVEEGKTRVSLSLGGLIFHEALRAVHRIPPQLPPPAARKLALQVDGHWGAAEAIIVEHLERVQDISYVARCRPLRFQPNQAGLNEFKLEEGKIEGRFSDGRWTLEYHVELSCDNPAYLEGVLVDLNHRLWGL